MEFKKIIVGTIVVAGLSISALALNANLNKGVDTTMPDSATISSGIISGINSDISSELTNSNNPASDENNSSDITTSQKASSDTIANPSSNIPIQSQTQNNSEPYSSTFVTTAGKEITVVVNPPIHSNSHVNVNEQQEKASSTMENSSSAT